MKFSTLRMKALGILSALGLTYWLAGAAFSGKGSQPGDFKIFAAAQVEAGKAEVRLRWMMTKGWLPEEGVNLYRSEPGGQEVLVNPAILGANRGKLANNPWKIPPAPKPNEGKTKVKLDYSYQDALDIVRTNQDKLQALIFAPSKRIPSAASASAFLALKEQRAQLFYPKEFDPQAKAKPVANVASPDLVDHQTLVQYYEKLGFEQKNQTARKRANFADESPAAMLRTHLVIGAMLHPDTIGNDLGLAFNDQKVEAGKKYHYALKVVENGKQMLVADCDVVVQNDPPLKAPTGLQGFQFDATTVCLRWDRIEPSDSLGLVSYDLFRNDKKLNQMPIVIQDLPIVKTKGITVGTHMEPMVLFHDTTAGSAAPGEVTYQIISVDMFGRRSPLSAPAKVKLDDLLAPPPVSHVAAERSVKAGKVQIVWTAVNEPDVVYNVSRINTESRIGKKEDLLIATPGDAPASLADYPELATLVTPKEPFGMMALRSKYKWFGFIDSPPEDHHFVYKVTAVYKTHPRQSPAQLTKEIPVPSPNAPPAPIVHATFVPVELAKMRDPANIKLEQKEVLKAKDIKLGDIKIQPIVEGKSGELFVGANHGMLQLVNIDSAKPQPTDLAGEIHLTWSPVPTAQAYRIYRASGTVYRVSDPKNPDAKHSHREEIAESDLKEGQFSLVGQVNGKTEFDDYVRRSPAHIYWYRVVAVSRWGVPPAAATSKTWSRAIRVRVPGTVPPAAPILVSAAADQIGSIQLTFAAPPASDAAVNYHVYRGETTSQNAGSEAIKDHKKILTEKGQRKGDTLVIVDKVVQSGRTYEYFVSADNGESPPIFSPASVRLRASTFKALVIAPTDVQAFKKADGILIQWKGVANAAGYIVEKSYTGPKGEFVQISDSRLDTSFLDRNPAPGPSFTYRVIAVDSADNVSNPNDYPLDQQSKDASKYPAQTTINVAGP